MSESAAATQEPRLRFDLYTLFPGIFAGPLDESILRRARDRSIVRIDIHDIRDWAVDRHRTVDDTTYGGGAGMVMMAPPIVSAVESILGADLARTRILVMSAAGGGSRPPAAGPPCAPTCWISTLFLHWSGRSSSRSWQSSAMVPKAECDI